MAFRDFHVKGRSKSIKNVKNHISFSIYKLKISTKFLYIDQEPKSEIDEKRNS